MIKLKNILSEGFAWERKADGSLPTLADTTAAYEAKLREEAEAVSIDEEAKPDFLDLDNDGDEEESMKDAAADVETTNESALITKGGLEALRQISLEDRIRKNLLGNK